MKTEPKPWFSVTNLADSGAVEMFIYDAIGRDDWSDSGLGAKEFVGALEKHPKDKDIRVRINSPGGNLWDALAIYNSLNARRDKVTTIVDGMAASAASVIAMAGSRLQMPSNALLMIHNPMTVAFGNADDMQRAINGLEAATKSIASIYAEKTQKPVEEIRKMMAAETWMTGEDSKAAGFADEVTGRIEMTNKFDLSAYKHPPLVDSSPVVEMNKPEEKGLIDTLKEALGIGKPPVTAPVVDEVTPLREELSQVKADLGTARQTIGTLESQVKTLEASVASKDKEISTFQSQLDTKAAEKAAQITASQGQPPVAAAVPSEKPADKKPDFSQLTGLEKAIAAHKANLQTTK